MPIREKLQGNEIKWLNEKEVADLIGGSVCTLRNQRCKGEGIPYYKIGRAVRYLFTDVIEYMESHKIKAA